MKLGLGVDVFNLFNTVVFGGIQTNITNANFGTGDLASQYAARGADQGAARVLNARAPGNGALTELNGLTTAAAEQRRLNGRVRRVGLRGRPTSANGSIADNERHANDSEVLVFHDRSDRAASLRDARRIVDVRTSARRDRQRAALFVFRCSVSLCVRPFAASSRAIGRRRFQMEHLAEVARLRAVVGV